MSEEYVKIGLEKYNNIQCELINKSEEIERLNNIINKIETFIEDRIDNYKYCEQYDIAYVLEKTRNDIKELKGSDNDG